MTFLQTVQDIVGQKFVYTKDSDMLPYVRGWNYGSGKAIAVVFPQSLLQQWQVVQACVAHDKIILMQASNTGLTGGSVPDGDTYDRDVVIVKGQAVRDPHLLDGGKQVVALPGTTLPQLETILKTVDREIHSVLGSTCVGASVIGGVCNSSGGSLLRRGPVYTELALYAQLNADGELELVNNLGIDLGDTPEEILNRVEKGDFTKENLPKTNLKASGTNYQHEVRQVNQPTPARYNANPKYLHEASGSAGKLAIFAVRLDTFPLAKQNEVFYIGTNNAKDLTTIRRHILQNFDHLPMQAESMDKKAFQMCCKYARDVYLLLTFLGAEYVPTFLKIKNKCDGMFSKIPFLGADFMDKFLVWIMAPFFFIFPKRLHRAGNTYDHSLFLNMIDEGVDDARAYLTDYFKDRHDAEFFQCTAKESKSAYDIRFVIGVAQPRLRILSGAHYKFLSYDVAYRRNDEDVPENIIPEAIKDALIPVGHVHHFFCHVAHESYLLDTRLCSYENAEQEFLSLFLKRGAKFPAEHNVGHKYHAEDTLKKFYGALDPTNTFNAGVGKMSKKKWYQD